jgi:hypothetical protein
MKTFYESCRSGLDRLGHFITDMANHADDLFAALDNELSNNIDFKYFSEPREFRC